MSFVYYSLLSTEGLPLIQAQLQARAPWTTPQLFSSYLTLLTSLDFADYDARRRALSAYASLLVPQFFDAFSFDPLAYPVVAPLQTRFPTPGCYVALFQNQYTTQISSLNAALAYRDTDGPISSPLLQFQTALAALSALFSSASGFYDRVTWEITNVLIWSVYPPLTV